MRYCGPRGIALSTFLSWPEADQDAALTWAEHEDQRCGTCGTHPDDWHGDRYAWHAEVSRCAGCEQLEQLAASDRTKDIGKGIKLHLARGSAAGCLRCRRDD